VAWIHICQLNDCNRGQPTEKEPNKNEELVFLLVELTFTLQNILARKKSLVICKCRSMLLKHQQW